MTSFFFFFVLCTRKENSLFTATQGSMYSMPFITEETTESMKEEE